MTNKWFHDETQEFGKTRTIQTQTQCTVKIIKIKGQINEILTKKACQRINKSKSWSLRG